MKIPRSKIKITGGKLRSSTSISLDWNIKTVGERRVSVCPSFCFHSNKESGRTQEICLKEVDHDAIYFELSIQTALSLVAALSNSSKESPLQSPEAKFLELALDQCFSEIYIVLLGDQKQRHVRIRRVCLKIGTEWRAYSVPAHEKKVDVSPYIL